MDEELTLQGVLGDAVGVLGFVEVEGEEQVYAVLTGQDLEEELGPVVADRARLCDLDDVAVDSEYQSAKLFEELAGHFCHLDLADISPLGTLPHVLELGGLDQDGIDRDLRPNRERPPSQQLSTHFHLRWRPLCLLADVLVESD